MRARWSYITDMGCRALPIVLMAVTACGQEIIVRDRDSGTTPPRDAGADAPRDGGVEDPDRDGGDVPRDGGETPRDGGADPCAGVPYCIVALTPSVDRTVVRAPVTFTPEIENAGGAVLSFAVEVDEIVATRRMALPALVLTDVTIDLSVDAAGTVSFVLADVPTWYATTTFEIVLHAEAAGGPDVTARASVTIEGNLLFGTSDSVYAVASDGLPATSVNFTQGRFLDGDSFVRGPRDVILLRNGELLVLDTGTTPQSLRRFRLTGENVLLGTFETDDMGTAFLDTATAYGMAQLDDGRVVVLDVRSNRTPVVRFVVFAEDGTYIRSIVPTDPTLRFDGIAPGPDNSFLAGETSTRKILQYVPEMSAPIDEFATEVANISALARAADGSLYIASGSSIARIGMDGVRVMVNAVPNPNIDWDHLTAYGPAGVMASDPYTDDRVNIIAIDGAMSLGYFRADNVGAYRTPYGMVQLD
ncbi:MAG: hypothetical protein RMA76_10480 [Deltaproteobacteria bacterium]|jgi:hypothetical protein